MFNISTFLDKIEKSVHSSKNDVENVKSIIYKHTNINIPVEQIEIKNSTAIITASTEVKNKIFIYKKNILDDCIKNVSVVCDIK